MSVLWIILTVIKYLLLAVLAVFLLVLFILALILFVPIRYSVNGNRDPSAMSLEARASWLLRLVRVRYTLEEGLAVWVAFFKLYPKAEKAVPKTETKKEIQEIQAKQEKQKTQEPLSGALSEEADEDLPEVEPEDEYFPVEDGETEELKGKYEVALPEEEEEEFEDFVDIIKDEEKPVKSKKRVRILSVISAVKNRVTHIIDAVKGVITKIKGIYDKIYLIDYHFGISTLFDASIDFIKRLFFSLGIKKFKVEGVVGVDDPCTTGMLLGAVYAVRPCIPGEVRIGSDFSGNKAEGMVELKGRCFLACVLTEILKFVFYKPVWGMIKYIWKGELPDE